MGFLATLTLLQALACTAACAPTSCGASNGPVASIKNGTYAGLHSDTFNQDFFLGIPFAKPPVGELRFSNPVPLEEDSWDGVRDATAYSPFCTGYGSASTGYATDEDCLYLNIVRPSGIQEPLPVAVWIYGGAWAQGGSGDKRYNLSYIVERSVDLDEPIMAVSINYRLSAWGFLASDEVKDSRNSNMGLRDQRLALHWLQENIAAFGGDGSAVTIFGQSAGAASVGYHINAFDGRDDHLFRYAIMESGAPLSLDNQTGSTQEAYNNLTIATGCDSAPDTLSCLKAAPYELVNDIVNRTSARGTWGPRIDGDLIARHSSEQLADGAFVHVPVIIGTTSDEGTPYAPGTINTTEDFLSWLSTQAVPESFAESLVSAYPNDPSLPLALANLPDDFIPGPEYGAQFRRVATYVGDTLFGAGRRHSARVWAASDLPVYSYRFNAQPAWASQMDGVPHFSEVAFALYTLAGEGYENGGRIGPFEGKPESYMELAELVNGDWISFVRHGDPNAWKGRAQFSVPEWPLYGEGEDKEKNFVFDANVTSFVEVDEWRKEAIDLILSRMDVYDR